MADFDEYEYLEKAVDNPDAKESVEEDGLSKNAKRRNEEDEEELKSKRSKGASEERGDKADRDGGRDRERDRREREKGDRDRDRGDRERRRSRDGDKDRERERDRDRERHRHRDRPRDKDREDKDRDRDRERIRDDEREYRSKPMEKRKKDKEAEQEIDPERDQRTVFAYQINLKADERDIYEFFSRAGKVRDVRLIMDRNSRRSKGVGYIEFYDVMSVPMAIALSGQLLLGTAVMVKPSEAEKNLVQTTPTPTMANIAGLTGIAGAGLLMGAMATRRLFVENLHYSMTQLELKQIFEPFGTVENIQLPLNPSTMQCNGSGYVQFEKAEDARAAQDALNGLDLAGKAMKVTPVPEPTLPIDFGPPISAGELDDDGARGMVMSARSRAELMQKLDRTGTVASVTGSLTLPQAPSAAGLLGAGLLPGMALPTALTMAAVPVIPTEIVLLTNMFDHTAERDENFESDIREDVEDECSKFGVVKMVHVDLTSAGNVYIRFDSAASAQTAQRALHGRWFAGKSISATFLTVEQFRGKFPLAPQ